MQYQKITYLFEFGILMFGELCKIFTVKAENLELRLIKFILNYYKFVKISKKSYRILFFRYMDALYIQQSSS